MLISFMLVQRKLKNSKHRSIPTESQQQLVDLISFAAME